MNPGPRKSLSAVHLPPLPLWAVRVAVVVLSLLTLGAGFIHYWNQRSEYVSQRKAELDSILKLKTGQIEQWHSERLADARVLSDSLNLGSMVARIPATPTPAGAAAIEEFLATIRESHEYVRLVFFDTGGRVILNIGSKGEPPLGHPSETVREVARRNTVEFGDLHHEKGSHPILLDLWIPLHAADPGGGPPDGRGAAPGARPADLPLSSRTELADAQLNR